MPEDQLTPLLQRIRYLERALAIQREDYLSKKKQYLAIIEKLRSMVNNGTITTYLSIDSVYYHLLEKLENGESNMDKSVDEIVDFIG